MLGLFVTSPCSLAAAPGTPAEVADASDKEEYKMDLPSSEESASEVDFTGTQRVQPGRNCKSDRHGMSLTKTVQPRKGQTMRRRS